MEEMIQEGKGWVAGGKKQGDAETTKPWEQGQTKVDS